ncbi:MAG: transglutaminase domain-containing protein [Peptoniphilus sp.]|uniref:transglutaminase domain-containing protein n=1 Tax=Peptoniphilus sp. TaxID=1971214 RepID=UPI002A75FFAD|nr:transglutaminase domain-containing protein [Peptoniphilus sp.]MDY2987400.1 transglutaminase domain-containing protein [Peptoniphilus sp.]
MNKNVKNVVLKGIVFGTLLGTLANTNSVQGVGQNNLQIKETTKKINLENKKSSNMQNVEIGGTDYIQLREFVNIINANASKGVKINFDDAKQEIKLSTDVKDREALKAVLETQAKEGNFLNTLVLNTKHKIMVNGKYFNLKGFLINGRNYFRLSDLAKVLNIGYYKHPETKQILINTKEGYFASQIKSDKEVKAEFALHTIEEETKDNLKKAEVKTSYEYVEFKEWENRYFEDLAELIYKDQNTTRKEQPKETKQEPKIEKSKDNKKLEPLKPIKPFKPEIITGYDKNPIDFEQHNKEEVRGQYTEEQLKHLTETEDSRKKTKIEIITGYDKKPIDFEQYNREEDYKDVKGQYTEEQLKHLTETEDGEINLKPAPSEKKPKFVAPVEDDFPDVTNYKETIGKPDRELFRGLKDAYINQLRKMGIKDKATEDAILENGNPYIIKQLYENAIKVQEEKDRIAHEKAVRKKELERKQKEEQEKQKKLELAQNEALQKLQAAGVKEAAFIYNYKTVEELNREVEKKIEEHKQAEKEQAAREQAEKEQTEKEQAEKEQAEKEQAEKEQADRIKMLESYKELLKREGIQDTSFLDNLKTKEEIEKECLERITAHKEELAEARANAIRELTEKGIKDTEFLTDIKTKEEINRLKEEKLAEKEEQEKEEVKEKTMDSVTIAEIKKDKIDYDKVLNFNERDFTGNKEGLKEFLKKHIYYLAPQAQFVAKVGEVKDVITELNNKSTDANVRYVRNWNFTYYTTMDSINNLTENDRKGSVELTFNYGENKETLKQIEDKIDKYIKENIEGKDLTEVQKVKVIHDYIIENTNYKVNDNKVDLERKNYNEQLPSSILFGDGGVCEAYAMTFSRMADRAGIDSKVVVGFHISPTQVPDEYIRKSQLEEKHKKIKAENFNIQSTDQQNHAWNAVKVDGKWYHIDVTHDDPKVFRDGKLDSSDPNFKTYDNFLKSDETMKKTRTWDEDYVEKAPEDYTKETFKYEKSIDGDTEIQIVDSEDFTNREKEVKQKDKENKELLKMVRPSDETLLDVTEENITEESKDLESVEEISKEAEVETGTEEA